MNIFIRVNAQGEPLSFADLLLSQATAAWSQGDDAVDAREEIRAFVDHLNEVGHRFSFKRDQVMKSTLMLTGAGSLRFRIENFDRTRMLAIRDEWEDIKSWLTLASSCSPASDSGRQPAREIVSCTRSLTTSNAAI